MITTGTIKILDSNNQEIENWELKNVQDINGHPLLHNQLEVGYYAKDVDGTIYIEEIKPQMSEGGLPMLIGTVVGKGDNWIHESTIEDQ